MKVKVYGHIKVSQLNNFQYFSYFCLKCHQYWIFNQFYFFQVCSADQSYVYVYKYNIFCYDVLFWWLVATLSMRTCFDWFWHNILSVFSCPFRLNLWYDEGQVEKKIVIIRWHLLWYEKNKTSSTTKSCMLYKANYPTCLI